MLLRPLPVSEPERILLMSNQYPKAGVKDSVNSGVPDYYFPMAQDAARLLTFAVKTAVPPRIRGSSDA